LPNSPEVVRVSAASDLVLFQRVSRFHRNAYPMTINLLLYFEDGCKANCLYCGQAREASRRRPRERTLIRVDWPIRPLDDVVEALRRLERCGTSVRPCRVCVATITHYRAVEAELEVIHRIRRETSFPITALVTPTLFREDEFRELKHVGADRIGIAIDCANPRIFDLLRGRKARGPHRWERYIEGVEEAVEVFGRGRVGIHIIVGLGETEKDVVELIQWAHDLGAETHLFAFHPEEGSILEGWPRVPIGQYRRVQMARYLIDNEIARAEEMKFNGWGQIIDFGIPKHMLKEIALSGLPFVTSGCPGCNRPWANEHPGEIPRNYPYPPSEEEALQCYQQMFLYISPPINNENQLVDYLVSTNAIDSQYSSTTLYNTVHLYTR